MFGGEEFAERAPNFWTMSNSFKRRPKHFWKGEWNFPAPPIYGHAYLGTNCAPVPAPSSPDKAISAISVKSPLHTGKRWHSAADQNVWAPIVFGLYCHSSQNLMNKFCMKSR